MGNLSEGTPIPWPELSKYSDHVRKNGIKQLINLFMRLHGRERDSLKWGDEVECMLVEFDDETKTAKLSLSGKEALLALTAAATSWDKTDAGTATWHPEFGRYMVESTPGEPYEADLKCFLRVEKNMQLRRAQARKALPANTHLMTLTVFPRLGCPHFTSPEALPNPGGDVSKSLFFPDDAINEHPRFSALAANIRRRRGKKVAMNIPIFKDVNTPSPFVEDFGERVEGDPEGGDQALQDCIFLDAMGFGMGNSCLQVTFQAKCIKQATFLYDHLAALTPVLLALSAAAPIFRGYLSDIDCRWNVISSSVDCRTPQERGEEPLTTDKMVIHKSRYASISSFLSENCQNRPEYEDVPLEMDEEVLKTLLDAGFTEKLARHFAHLFIRHPMVVYEELLHQDNEKDTDHFENIQSTNWQTLRFKPPPPNSDIGWRIEFRPTEIQITDFENAALSVFIVLLTRTILSFNLNLYMPISKIDENLEKAQLRNALHEQKFWFRKYLSDEKPVYFDDDDDEGEGDDDDAEGGDEAKSGNEGPMSPDALMAAVHAKLVDHKERLASSKASGRQPLVHDSGCNQPDCTATLVTKPPAHTSGSTTPPPPPCDPCSDENDAGKEKGNAGCGDLPDCLLEEYSINELINGADDRFPGFLPLVKTYLKGMHVDIDTRRRLNHYLDFVGARARGDVPTTATYIRNFVQSHPEYKQDSVVSDAINYDLLKHLDGIASGEVCGKGLLGAFAASARSHEEGAAEVPTKE